MSNGMDTHWHLDKRVSVGHLVTTITVAVAVVAWSFQIQNRITVTEVKLDKLEEAFVSMRADQGVQYDEIIRRLERLSDKLDDKSDKD